MRLEAFVYIYLISLSKYTDKYSLRVKGIEGNNDSLAWSCMVDRNAWPEEAQGRTQYPSGQCLQGALRCRESPWPRKLYPSGQAACSHWLRWEYKSQIQICFRAFHGLDCLAWYLDLSPAQACFSLPSPPQVLIYNKHSACKTPLQWEPNLGQYCFWIPFI